MNEVNRPRVLVVDDDRDILELLAYNLEKDGYRVKVVEDSKKVIRAAKTFQPDLIVLDLMMPNPNGIELCRLLRGMKEFQHTYIFFLTAKSDAYYQQAALETGADDYIEKIMGLRSLTHKIKAVLKKNLIISKRQSDASFGDLTLKRKSLTAVFHDKEIKLSKPEFELLFFLAQNEGKGISEDNLVYYLWGSEIYLTSSTIGNYITGLQAKFSDKLIMRTDTGQYYYSS
jgi:two-component system, OmpR family, alkaline phosphatase synthesis response regulator PhoP